MNERENSVYVCPCCGEIGTTTPNSSYMCNHCHIIVIETDKKRGDIETARMNGEEFQLRETIRKRYVYNSPKFNQSSFQKVCGQEYKDQELIQKLKTTPHCPRCWSFDIKQTFISEITEAIFGSSPTWFCNNCHLKWK